MKDRKWYKLDNIGKFYSSIADRQVQNIFRYSATLTEEINEEQLQLALDNTIDIYSNFNVNLKKGIFWYYLEETNKKNKVTVENLPICFRLYNNSDDFLYRVSYYKKRINFEVSHIITDGRGSVDFFKTLIGNYLKIKYQLKNIDLTTKASYLEKAEDSFNKYYKKTKKSNEEKGKVYFYKSKKLKNKIRFLETHLPLPKVLELSHKYNATLTSLLVSVLIYSCKDVIKESDFNKTIKIDIPVDLRSYYKSTSSKNFFGLTSVSYKFKNRNDKLEDVIKEVNKQFKTNLTAEKLSERVNYMVAFEKNFICRISPIYLKNLVLRKIDKLSEDKSTSCISNLGKISFDKQLEKYIENVNILNATTSFQFTLCSFKDDLSIGISTKYQYNEIIKNFCRFFTDENIEILINASEVD